MPSYITGTHGPNWDDSGLPKSVREYLAVGAEKGNRNNELFKVACQLRDYGYPQAQAEAPLIARAIADGLSEEAARRTIKSAYHQAPRDPAGEPASARSQNPPTSQPGAVAIPLPSPLPDGYRLLLETAFREGERIAIGKGKYNSRGELEIDYGDVRLRSMWLKEGPPQNLEGVFIRINPMKYRGAKNGDVTAYRHVLVEFDSGSKESQYGALVGSGMPITVIVDSGKRGLHGWVQVNAADEAQYNERAGIVYKHFRQYDFFDDGNKAPNKFSRLPGVERQLYDERGKPAGVVRQELLAVNVGSAGWEQYEKGQKPAAEDLERFSEKRRAYYDRVEQPMPEPMAKEAYYGRAGQIVDIIRKAGTEACPESLLVQFLIVIGNLVGRKPYRHQAGTHRLNEFGTLVGESGSSCKGTSWNALYHLHELLDSGWLSNRVQDGFPTGEGIIDSVRDSGSRRTRGGKTVTDPGEKDKRLLIMEEEFGQILIMAKREGNNISVVLRNAWDAKNVLSTRGKNDPRKATGAHISLIGHITPRELRSLLTDIDSTNGFANRITWIAVAGMGEVAIPPRIDWQKDHPGLVQDLRNIIDNFQNRPASEMDWSPEGRTLWNQYHREQRKRRFGGMIGPILKRSVAHVLRYTMIYAILDNSNLFLAPHLKAAIALVRYSERSAQWCFGEKTGNREADKILWELDRIPEGLSKSEIFKICRNRSVTEINMALAILRDNQQADFAVEQAASSDKPTERWYATRRKGNS